jgi:hypothetical protein
MPKVSRDVLKSFFQAGSKPSSVHFTSLIDSLLHYSEDREFIGLKAYSPGNNYLAGDCIVYNNDIYEALVQTSGEFTEQHWKAISGASQNDQTIASAFGSDYLFEESDEESFMSSDSIMVSKLIVNTGLRTGIYRLQWCLVARHQQQGGMGKFQLQNSSTSTVIGSSLICKQNNTLERIPVGGLARITLDGTNQVFELQYQTLDNGMRQYVKDAKIELIKISD